MKRQVEIGVVALLLLLAVASLWTYFAPFDEAEDSVGSFSLSPRPPWTVENTSDLGEHGEGSLTLANNVGAFVVATEGAGRADVKRDMALWRQLADRGELDAHFASFEWEGHSVESMVAVMDVQTKTLTMEFHILDGEKRSLVLSVNNYPRVGEGGLSNDELFLAVVGDIGLAP